VGEGDNNLRYGVITVVRTQISLTEEEYVAAKREARRLGISLAELLRRSLRHMLPVDEARPWMRYAGMIESGDAASSQPRRRTGLWPQGLTPTSTRRPSSPS
jgi:hypothetical protein